MFKFLENSGLEFGWEILLQVGDLNIENPTFGQNYFHKGSMCEFLDQNFVHEFQLRAHKVVPEAGCTQLYAHRLRSIAKIWKFADKKRHHFTRQIIEVVKPSSRADIAKWFSLELKPLGTETHLLLVLYSTGGSGRETTAHNTLPAIVRYEYSKKSHAYRAGSVGARATAINLNKIYWHPFSETQYSLREKIFYYGGAPE